MRSQRQRELTSTDTLIRTLVEVPLSLRPELLNQNQHLPLDLLVSRILEKIHQKQRLNRRLMVPLLVLVIIELAYVLQTVHGLIPLWEVCLLLVIPALLAVQFRKYPGEENTLILLARRREELGPEEVPLVLMRLQAAHSVMVMEAIEAVQVLRQWLVTILPRLTEPQCQALTEPEREFLRGMVRRGGAEEKVAGLLVLATARDEDTLPLAKLLAIDAPDTDERVREAAQEVLRTLWG